ncbi:MAG: right-handed parallel beta-helix repeat-containing protein [Armatimonadetes bacterium]|nr:right-handed parallel beta-helix repeat-containing protein [Armatimonadota bacterium]
MMALVGTSAYGMDLHVATHGSDSNPGTRKAPFATLARARDAVRKIKITQGLPEGGVTVWVHKGIYPQAAGFTLTEEDSGTRQRPIAYRAVRKGEARLSGGKEIPVKAFQPLTEAAALARLEEKAGPHVLCADLKSRGFGEFGQFQDAFEGTPAVPELFFNDRRMTLARWPNDDWARVAKVIESGPAPWRNHASDQPGTFEYEGDRPSRWLSAPSVWLHGYWCFDWHSETIRVRSIDPKTRQITFARPHVYGLGSGNPAPRRFYAVNLLEELDKPGEYYLDGERGLLYFWPPEPLGRGRVVLSALREPVIFLQNASHIILQGLTVEECIGTGICMNGGRENLIAACLAQNTGQSGIEIEGGNSHRVAACDIHDTGTAGLHIGGGDRKTLTPSHHEAINNHIYRVSRRQRTHAYHIHVSGVGVRLAHNLLHDGPHQAIGLWGNDHLIEYNEIHHTGMETDDCGAFYMGRNPSERGNILRYNFWHDIGSALTHGSCAVYFDDGTGGQTVFGNVFYRAAGGQFGAVFVHGGHNNRVRNNIFIECKKAIGHAPWNDAYWNEWIEGDLWRERLLKEVDITSPLYLNRYSELKNFMDTASRPRFNYASRNVAYRCETFLSGNWKETDNLITSDDPGFVDTASLNFRLKDDAPVYQKIPGFEKIPFEKIGLYRDPLRVRLPKDR